MGTLEHVSCMSSGVQLEPRRREGRAVAKRKQAELQLCGGWGHGLFTCVTSVSLPVPGIL